MSSSATDTSTPGTTPTTTTPIQRKKRGSGALIAVVVVIVVIILIVGLGYAAGWFKTSSSSTTGTKGCTLPSASDFKGEGSTLVAPLMDQWATSYWTHTQLTYDSAGSSSGITAITDKVVDFGASDYPLTTAQLAAIPGLITIPESVGAVVPIYNLPGISTLNFNGSVLAQMFDGQITSWNNTALQALNPGVTLPTNSIIPVHRTGGSGTSFIFTSFLSAENAYWLTNYGKNPEWPSNITVGTGASGNSGEADTVGTTAYALGYVDLNYALNSGSSIGIGDVQNKAGNFIRASVVNTESALADSNPTLPTSGGQSWFNVSVLNAPGTADYPIVGLTYLLVYGNLTSSFLSYTLTNAENLVDFIHWAITTGQSWSAPLYYAPISTAILNLDNTTLSAMTYDGSAIPVCVPSGGGAPT